MLRTFFCHTGPPEPALTTPFRLGYRPSLDGLRGLSILAVVLLHTNVPFVLGGWVGVDVFFVLSGFLITTLLLQEWERTGAINFRNFYLRRALRLLPALVVMLGFCWGYALLYLPPARQGLTRDGVLSALGYYANWRIIRAASSNDLLSHTWSLSVEEQFYFLWPPVLGVLLWLRLRRRWVAAVVVLGIAASAFLRARMWQIGYGSILELSMRLATRGDTLLVGCLTALLLHWGLAPRSRLGRWLTHSGAGLALGYLGWVCVTGRHDQGVWYRGGFTLVAVAVAVLIVSLLSAPPRPVTWLFESRPLVWLGRLSYGLYLWHYPLYLIQLGVFFRLSMVTHDLVGLWLPMPVHWPVVYGACIGFAVLSYYLVERPFLRLKGKLEKPASAPATGKLAA